MKQIKKMIIIVFTCFCLSACDISNQNTSNINKTGTQYELDNVSFIYPSTFTAGDIISTNENKESYVSKSVILTDSNSSIKLEVKHIIEDNVEDELIQLYKVDLETRGYVVLSDTKVLLDNGDDCYEIVVENNTNKAKVLVIYEDGIRYSLSYQAPIEEYNKNVSNINQYLYSFSVKENGDM